MSRNSYREAYEEAFKKEKHDYWLWTWILIGVFIIGFIVISLIEGLPETKNTLIYLAFFVGILVIRHLTYVFVDKKDLKEEFRQR